VWCVVVAAAVVVHRCWNRNRYAAAAAHILDVVDVAVAGMDDDTWSWHGVHCVVVLVNVVDVWLQVQVLLKVVVVYDNVEQFHACAVVAVDA